MGEYPPGSDAPMKPKKPTYENIEAVLKEVSHPDLKEAAEMLDPHIKRANILLKTLGQKGRIRALNIKSDDLRKIRQFRNPKKEVQDMIVGFALLLGEYEGFTRV